MLKSNFVNRVKSQAYVYLTIIIERIQQIKANKINKYTC